MEQWWHNRASFSRPASHYVCTIGESRPSNMFGMARKSLRDALAHNLRRLMADRPDKSTPAKLAKFCHWPKISAKAGKKISPRMIAYMLDGAQDHHAPSLDAVEGVAEGLGVSDLELFADREAYALAAEIEKLSPANRAKIKELIFLYRGMEAAGSGTPLGVQAQQ